MPTLAVGMDHRAKDAKVGLAVAGWAQPALIGVTCSTRLIQERLTTRLVQAAPANPAKYSPMTTALRYPHLSLDADGTARIEKTRYKVIHLAGEHYHYGWSAEEILRQHPDLRPEQVYAALTYFYDHHGTLVERLRASDMAAQAPVARQPLSRSELLKRRESRKS